MKRRFIIVIIFICIGCHLFGEMLLENDVSVESVRSTSMGGFHAGYSNDFDVLFSNPAGFRQAGKSIRYSQLSMGLHGPVFDVTTLLLKVLDGTDYADLLLEEENLDLMTSLYAGGEVTGPLSAAYIGENFGIGFFNTVSLMFDTPSTLEITTTLSEQLLLLGGYGFELPIHYDKQRFEAGVTLKGFMRSEGGFSTTVVMLGDVLEDFSGNLFLDQPYDVISGIGFDLGFLHTYDKIWSWGIVFQDVYTPTVRSSYSTMRDFMDGADAADTQYGVVPFKMNIGASYHPHLIGMRTYVSDFSVSLDYRDILDFALYPKKSVNPALHVGAGIECTVLEILSLRGGFGQGYFSSGLGVKLGIVDFGLSMYGRENSTEPGMDPVYNVMLGIDIES